MAKMNNDEGTRARRARTDRRGRPVETARDGERKRSRVLGFLLIGTGSLSLILTLMFSGLPALSSVPEKISRLWTNVAARFKVWIYGPEREPSPWDFSNVKPLEELKAVPSAQGWSALDSFYATHPAVEGEEEYYLDPALWREPARKGDGASAEALAGTPVAAGMAALGVTDTSMAAPMSSRRMGLWTGPADGAPVDTSIRPAQDQLKRQDSIAATDAFFPVAADSAFNGASGAAGADGSAQAASSTQASASDSAPATASADAPTSQKPLHVEFWESPVHYKGYQLNGNNLILYGINEADSLRFENHPDGVWMYHKEAVYRLTTSSEMQRFELISGTSSLEEPEGGAEDEETADGPALGNASPARSKGSDSSNGSK